MWQPILSARRDRASENRDEFLTVMHDYLFWLVLVLWTLFTIGILYYQEIGQFCLLIGCIMTHALISYWLDDWLTNASALIYISRQQSLCLRHLTKLN